MNAYRNANPVKCGTHSLFCQASYWYDCIPTMRHYWLRTLMRVFDKIVREHAVLPRCVWDPMKRGGASGRPHVCV
jgi:hypothetical protein